MAGSLTVALRAAQSGLLTTQSAVDATANNIANVNTEGYSRKIVNFEQRVLSGSGAGVQLSDFTRAIDEGLLKDLRRQLSETNNLEGQSSYFQRLQLLFGSPDDNSSIAHILDSFAQAAESLAVSPDKTLEQNEFVRQANEVALKLRDMTEEIQALRAQADQEIEDVVGEINDLAADIASLNDKIIRNQAVSNDITDLEDKRDVALNKLSELVDITYFERSDGDMVVFTSDGFTLVDRTESTLIHNAVGLVGSTSTYAEGDINGIFVNEEIAANDLTTRVTGGKLAGLIEQRDTILPNLQSQLDELASELRDQVNAIHNQGTPVPGLQSMGGTRTFIDSANQKIQLDPTNSQDDVKILLFDSNGNEQATTTLNTIMTSGLYGSGTQTDHGLWSVDEVTASLEDWLQANGAGSATVSVDSTGKVNIELNTTSRYLAFRDQTNGTDGSTHEDASVGFDSDGDGDIDETISGFSNFFGLNDLFTDATDATLYQSEVVSTSFTASAATLTFYDSAGGVGTGNELGTVSIAQGDSLNTIASKINSADIGISASVVPDGSGSRLRVQHDAGRQMVITQGASDTLLTDGLGFRDADVRAAATIAVRSDILATPSLVTTAGVRYNSDSGEYFLTAGDNSIAQRMAETINGKNGFEASGGLITSNKTFQEYAASILAANAEKADTNQGRLRVQQGLADSLQLKADTVSGVNLDEEMSNLILFQQAFSASARVISVIQDMFDTLDDAV